MARFKQWHKYRNSENGTLYFKIPWLVFGSIEFLKNWLTQDMHVFEYGSGGSTLFCAEHAKSIFSVDHDPEWYSITKDAIEKANFNNVDYNLIKPQLYNNYQSDNYLKLEECISVRGEFSGMNFKEYVHAIDHFDDAFFDLVIVDGRARLSCIGKAMRKIKKDGFLLLDNAEREYYLQPNEEILDKTKWERKDFLGHFPFAPASVINKTSLFKKLY